MVDNKDLLSADFTARVFDSTAAVTEAIHSGRLKPRDAIVCRYQGPRGGPAMTECLGIVTQLKTKRVKDVAVITDGRFSGWTKGYLAIGHVCPEAQVGGPLALVCEGDTIRVDVPNRKLDSSCRMERWRREGRSGFPPTKRT